MPRYGITALIAIGLVILSSCNKDTQVFPTGPRTSPQTMAVAAPAANPAIVYLGAGSGSGKTATLPSLSVMNADGSNQTAILSSNSLALGGGFYATHPTWSPDGKHIAFWEASSTTSGTGRNKTTTTTYSIWALDIAVVNGVPTASNVHQVVALTAGHTASGLNWSPSSTASELAWIEEYSGTYAVNVVSTTGGTPTTLCSVSGGEFLDDIGGLAWSGDGSTLAVNHIPSANTWYPDALWLIDRNAQNVKNKLKYPAGQTYEDFLVWGRSNNTIACLSEVNGAGPFYVFTMDMSGVTSSSTTAPTLTQLTSVAADDGGKLQGLNWSPDATMVMYTNNTTFNLETYTLATGVTQVVTAAKNSLRWMQ